MGPRRGLLEKFAFSLKLVECGFLTSSSRCETEALPFLNAASEESSFLYRPQVILNTIPKNGSEHIKRFTPVGIITALVSELVPFDDFLFLTFSFSAFVVAENSGFVDRFSFPCILRESQTFHRIPSAFHRPTLCYEKS